MKIPIDIKLNMIGAVILLASGMMSSNSLLIMTGILMLTIMLAASWVIEELKAWWGKENE